MFYLKMRCVSKMLTSLATILLFPWIPVLAQTCPSSYSLPNMELKGHVITNYSMQTSTRCIDKCASQAGCHSINYCSSQGICELNNANHLSNPESVVYSAGCQYLNYFLRAVPRCSNKLCSYPLECEVDNNGQDYQCKSCKDKHKVLRFPEKSVTNYVIYENPFSTGLTAFTLSMWVDTRNTPDTAHIFSYAKTTQTNEILIGVKTTKTVLWLNGIYHSLAITPDGQWHHICVTWTNVDGSYSMYIDGISKSQGNMKTGHVIQKGAVVLGQDQDSYKGTFSASQAFQGNLTSVNMWDKVLTADEVSALASRCSTAEGNIIKWTDFHDKQIAGNLKLVCSRFCVP